MIPKHSVESRVIIINKLKVPSSDMTAKLLYKESELDSYPKKE